MERRKSCPVCDGEMVIQLSFRVSIGDTVEHAVCLDCGYEEECDDGD